MSHAWAVALPNRAIAAAGQLRTTPGIAVFQDGAHLWLRGTELSKDLDRQLRCLPGARRHAVLPDGQLREVGHRLPRGRLPDGPWVALAEWLSVALPHGALGGVCDDRVRLALVRSPRPEAANLLLLDVSCFAAYAATAPQVRLDRWTLAASSAGRVAVRGVPLPPLPGEQFVEREGLAVPAGWTWTPPVEAAVLRTVLMLAAGDVALLHADGTWQRIAAQDFVRATRSAARGLPPNPDAA